MKCRVKFLVNPGAEPSYTLRFPALTPRKRGRANLKVILPRTEAVGELVKELSESLGGKFNWELEWNWKNTPAALVRNQELMEELTRVFSSPRETSPWVGEPHLPLPLFCSLTREEGEGLVERLVSHVRVHRQNPPLTPSSAKERKKLVNFVRSVLHRSELTEGQCLYLAQNAGLKLSYELYHS